MQYVQYKLFALLYIIDMELRQIRYFLRVATEGSFSRAADSLQMTQPPLSIAISNLERELGVKLLHREARGVNTTEAGAVFAKSAEEILRNLDDLARGMRSLPLGQVGQLSIAAVPTITWFLLPQLLRAFLATHPNVNVTVSDPPPAQVIDMVVNGEADIGLISTVNASHLAESYRSSLHVMSAADMPIVVALPPLYASAPAKVSLMELHDLDWIVPKRSLRINGLPELFDSLWERLNLTPPVVHRVTTLQTALPLVATGIGAALVPDSARTVSNSGVVLREVEEGVRPMQAGVIWSKNRATSAATQEMIDLLRSGALAPTNTRTSQGN